MSATAETWLTIPPRAALLLGGVRWSHGCDALEDATGQTIALAAELEQVFDGLFSAGPVPHFAYVIGLLRAMKFGSSDAQFERLRRAYTAAKDSTALARNAGVLIGELCRDLQWKHRPALSGVLLTLQSMQRNGERRRPALAHEPPVPLAEFLGTLAALLKGFDDNDLYHRLRFGREAIPEPKRIEEALDSLPLRVMKLQAAARLNPRLIGAASLVPVFDAALALPPRKQSAETLPQGGYSDVTTRGEPDRLLPSQFALDADDFIRRFAERELLYFQREEPHVAQKPERVIVLDQGVRTWGSVRLALAGAALSLLKADVRRVGDVRIHFTSAGQAIDLRRHDVEAIVKTFEASDLTPHPAEAFKRALVDASDPAIPRDIVLLTHPKNAVIPTLEAHRHDRPADRIFALAVEESGLATLNEFLDGGVRTLRSFRLNLAAAETLRLSNEIKPLPAFNAAAWTGDVEPIGFPFRPGLLGDPLKLAFSADGQWLVILCRDGLLHSLAFDGSPPEVLPRAFRNGVVLKSIEAILGVNEGIAVCGRVKKTVEPLKPGIGVTINSPLPVVMTSTISFTPPGETESDEEYVVAHYDFASRKLRLHSAGPVRGECEWTARPMLNCVLRLVKDVNDGFPKVIELNTVDNNQSPSHYSSAGDALFMAKSKSPPPYELKIITNVSSPPRSAGPFLRVMESMIHVEVDSPAWNPFMPQSDGKALLTARTALSAHLAGDVLALELSDAKQNRNLVLFQAPNGRILQEYGSYYAGPPFALSSSGERLALRRHKRDVAVYATAEAGAPLAAALPAHLHDRIAVRLSDRPFELILRIGQYQHTFRIDDGILTTSHTVTDGEIKSYRESAALASYDAYRFMAQWEAEDRFCKAVADRWGAVHLLTPQNLLVASFLIRRRKAAVWIPDGTFWGDAALIGGPPHPNAAARIGQAILWKGAL